MTNYLLVFANLLFPWDISLNTLKDGSPVLNLASFVQTWMPPQADDLVRENVSKNLIGSRLFISRFVLIELSLDSDEYPATRMSNQSSSFDTHL